MEKIDKSTWKKTADEAFALFKEYDSNPNWKVFATDPCKKSSMEIEDRLTTKGEKQIKFSYNDTIAFLVDSTNMSAVDPMNEMTKQLYKDPTYEVVYMIYKGIWPVSGRDLVLLAVDKEQNDTYYIITKSINYNYPAERNGLVRAEVYLGAYSIKKTGENKCLVTYISDVDSKGSIPQIIKNQLAKQQAGVPANVQKAMEKALKK